MDEQPKSNALSKPSEILSVVQKKELLQHLGITAIALGLEVSSLRLEVVLRFVADIPFEKLAPVIADWPNRNDFFPTPKRVRDAVFGSADELSAKTESEAELAWQRVLAVADEWNPQTKWRNGEQPPLSKRDRFALRSVGGMERFFYVSKQNADFGILRRDFIKVWMLAEKAIQIKETEKSDNGDGNHTLLGDRNAGRREDRNILKN